MTFSFKTIPSIHAPWIRDLAPREKAFVSMQAHTSYSTVNMKDSRAVLRLDIGVPTIIYILAPINVPLYNPCPVGLPELSTVAHMARVFWGQSEALNRRTLAYWAAVKELKLSCHSMDIHKIVGFLDYGNLN